MEELKNTIFTWRLQIEKYRWMLLKFLPIIIRRIKCMLLTFKNTNDIINLIWKNELCKKLCWWYFVYLKKFKVSLPLYTYYKNKSLQKYTKTLKFTKIKVTLEFIKVSKWIQQHNTKEQNYQSFLKNKGKYIILIEERLFKTR